MITNPVSLPRLSIIIPSYQQGQFIERTIRSIVEQEYPNLELILMDGGSTDETMSIVKRYECHFAHIFSGPDGGQSAAIRKGFEIAGGQYISWLNSDDTYCEGALFVIGRYFAENPQTKFVYGNMNLIDRDDKIFAFKRSAKFVLGVMKYAFLTVPQQSAFWAKDLYDEVGGVDPALRFCMDYDLFVRMASRSAPVHIDRTIGNFRIHSSSKTSTLEPIRLSEDRLVQTRYCKIKPARQLAFRLTRMFYLTVLCGLLIMNGSFFDRVARRIRNNMKSKCS
jgi:glycosyltransferase involved in cell wall biosynthesis